MSRLRPLINRVPGALAIVVSILLAFAIDAAWAERSEAKEEVRLLESLRAEFHVNRDRASQGLAFHRGLHSTAWALMEASTQRPLEITADSVDHLISGITWYGASILRMESSALDAAVLGGQFDLIRDEELRRLLTRWRRELEVLATVELQEFNFYTEVWLPLLSDRSNVAQIANANWVRPDGVSFDPEGGSMPEALDEYDHRALLADPEFQNALVVRVFVQYDLLSEYSTLSSMVDAILEALQSDAG